MADTLVITGRLALGGLFVLAGLGHFRTMDAATGLMARHGVPYPRLLLIIGSVFQTTAGALLMTGKFVLFAAFGLIVFTITATAMVLRFWELPEGPERRGMSNAFLSNLGVVGGLLLAAASHT